MKGHALFLNWHNSTNLQNFVDSINENNFGLFLKDNKIDYVVFWKPILDRSSFRKIKLEKNKTITLIENELQLLNSNDPFTYKVRQ